MSSGDRYLGYMVWWRVGEPRIRASQVAERIGELGMPMPRRSVPSDVFRRLSSLVDTYDLDNERSIMLDLHRVPSQSTMLVRHIVRSVRKGGVLQKKHRVGDAAFYKPPKGQPHRARVRITVYPEGLPDRQRIERFGESLRVEYARQLDAIDAQGARRMVRNFLASVGALYLNGPYFVVAAEDVRRLEQLIDIIGGGSEVMGIPVVDDESNRQLIERARTTQLPKEEADE